MRYEAFYWLDLEALSYAVVDAFAWSLCIGAIIFCVAAAVMLVDRLVR